MASSYLDEVNNYIDENMGNFIIGLTDAVAIESVSSSRENRGDVIRMLESLATRMRKLKIDVSQRNLGMDPNYPDEKVLLPPVILASLGNDLNKKNLCIYGHLDVQPAKFSDGWKYEPFVMTVEEDMMYGRGTTDDKGPVLGWLNAIEAFHETETEIPVNLKFVFEGMEESGSTGLDKLIESEKEGFFKDVEYISVSDNYWLGTGKPCLTYGLRGLVYFHVTVDCAEMDLHSGSHGGPVYEAMSDLVALLGSLVDEKGIITVDDVYKSVLPVTEEEDALYDGLDFDKLEYQNMIGVHGLTTDSDKDTLMRRWRYPSLTIHGIEGAFSDPGDVTIIPRKVTGKFSIRLVPEQEPDNIGRLVKKHLKKVHHDRGSPNPLEIDIRDGSALPWLGETDNELYEAGKRATKTIYDVEPDYTREGGTIDVVLTLAKTTGKDVMLLPMGRSDDAPHSQNEKLNISNFQKGMKLFAAFLEELAVAEPSTSGQHPHKKLRSCGCPHKKSCTLACPQRKHKHQK